MRPIFYLILAAMLVLFACKKKTDSAAAAASPTDIQTAPLVDTTTQTANADDAAASAGWAASDTTPVTSSNAATVMDKNNSAEIVVSALNNAAPSASRAVRSLAQFAAQKEITKTMRNYNWAKPNQATTTTVDADGYTVTSINETINYNGTCSGGSGSAKAGTVGLTGSFVATLKSKDTTSDVKFDLNSSDDGTFALNFNITGCADSKGTVIYGKGASTSTSTGTYAGSLTIANKQITDASYTTSGNGTSKESGGYAIQVSTGEKYKIGFDQDLKVSYSLSGSGWDSTSGSFANNTGNATILLISTLISEGTTYTCTLDKTYTGAEIQAAGFDASLDIICQ